MLISEIKTEKLASLLLSEEGISVFTSMHMRHSFLRRGFPLHIICSN